MEQTLKDKVAFVTGSARRVGRAILLALAEAGCHVVVHHSGASSAEAEETAATARALGRQALVVAGNHAHYEAIQANFEALQAYFGRLDVMVNSAGVFPSADFLDISRESWEETLALNLSAPFWCTQMAGRMMQQSGGGGVIINIGDGAGLRPWIRRPHHSISKAGVVMLTEVAARSLAKYQIRVNCLIPGPVLPAPNMDENYWAKVVTRLPLARSGDPDDVARAVVFLAQNDFITGAVLRVDGGEYIGIGYE